MKQRQISETDRAELKRLNDNVRNALAQRRAWLDSKMAEYATVQVGETLYDMSTFRPLGMVSRHYRCWQNRNDGVLDDHLDIQYEFRVSQNGFDNTSRQPFLSVGSETDAEDERRRKFSGKSLVVENGD